MFTQVKMQDLNNKYSFKIVQFQAPSNTKFINNNLDYHLQVLRP